MTEIETLIAELGPTCPVALLSHSKTEAAAMFTRPGHTVKHGGLTVHVFTERSGFRVLVADRAGSGVSLEVPCPTDAVQMPDGHVVA